MNEQLFNNLRMQFEGKKIITENVSDNMNFVCQSKEDANKYKWLYHCTTSLAFLSILSNREFWLNNLKLVNDKEEAERIDVPAYESSYYIACFTYKNDIPKEHWEEYSSITDGVLIGVQKEWFLRSACFMNNRNEKEKDDFFKIHANRREALNFKVQEQYNNKIVNPFFINEFSFYKVIYCDELRKNIQGKGYIQLSNSIIPVKTFTPTVAGIIKSTHGLSNRAGKDSHEKDWSSEKEVRLKVGIQQFENRKNGNISHDEMIVDGPYHAKIAVPISEEAFNSIKIRFSPNFTDRDAFITRIKSIQPQSKIEILE